MVPPGTGPRAPLRAAFPPSLESNVPSGPWMRAMKFVAGGHCLLGLGFGDRWEQARFVDVKFFVVVMKFFVALCLWQ